MNKKFLSAVLFGALMVSSTGTFVSCKDYDDDIDEINATLNDLKSQIAALQTKVDNGDYVTGVSKTADGKGMTFTFSKGSPVTVTLDVKDGEAGTPGAPGKDAQQVTVDEKTGELKIDGKGTGIFPAKDAAKAPVKAENGYWYTLNEKGEYENTNIPVSGITVTGSELTGYTLTVYSTDGEKVIILPTAASSLTSVEVEASSLAYFTNYASSSISNDNGGIKWGVVSKAIDWKGPKGNIAKDQLLVGQISTQKVKVLPATYLLGEQTLSLVATDGSVAPVTVTATANTQDNAEHTGGRAIKTGDWVLSITPNSAVSGDNIGSAFTSDNKNLKYALAVNSNIMTDYVFVIDTQTNEESDLNSAITANITNLYLGDKNISSTNKLKVGENTLTYKDAMVYDSYLSFEGTNIALAKTLGVTVNGMTVKVPATAANTNGLQVTIHVIDITGKATSQLQTLHFGTSEISSGDVIAETVYKVMPSDRKNIVIKLGDVLASMSDIDAEKVKNMNQLSIAVKDNKTTEFIAAITPSYGKTLKDNGVDIKDSYNAVNDDVRDLKYITIPTTNIQSGAKAGKYTLILTIKDTKDGNEIKKVEMPVSITLPAFTEIFEKSAAWNDNVVSMYLNNNKMADFTTAYKYDVNLTSKMNVEFTKINNKVPATWNAQNNGNITIVPAVAVTNGVAKDVEAETSLTIGGKLVIKSGKYTVHFIAPLNGAALKLYKDNAAIEATVTGDNGSFDAYTPAAGNVKAKGLAINVKSKDYALNANVNGVDLSNYNYAANYSFDAKAGNKATATFINGKLNVNGLAAGTYTTTLTITIIDGNNIKTIVTLPIKVNN